MLHSTRHLRGTKFRCVHRCNTSGRHEEFPLRKACSYRCKTLVCKLAAERRGWLFPASAQKTPARFDAKSRPVPCPPLAQSAAFWTSRRGTRRHGGARRGTVMFDFVPDLVRSVLYSVRQQGGQSSFHHRQTRHGPACYPNSAEDSWYTAPYPCEATRPGVDLESIGNVSTGCIALLAVPPTMSYHVPKSMFMNWQQLLSDTPY